MYNLLWMLMKVAIIMHYKPLICLAYIELNQTMLNIFSHNEFQSLLNGPAEPKTSEAYLREFLYYKIHKHSNWFKKSYLRKMHELSYTPLVLNTYLF